MTKLITTTFWDEESECFVTKCDKYPGVIGASTEENESKNLFDEHLKRYKEAKKQGRLSKKLGRPQKDNIPLHCNINKNSKKYIDMLSRSTYGRQGSTIDYLVDFHKKHSESKLV